MTRISGLAAAVLFISATAPALAQDSFAGQQQVPSAWGQGQQGGMPGMQPMPMPQGGAMPGQMQGQTADNMGMLPGMPMQPGMVMPGQQPGMMNGAAMQQPGMSGMAMQPGVMGQQPGVMPGQPGMTMGQQPGMMPGQQPGFSMPGGAGQVPPGMAGQLTQPAGGDPLDALAQMERRDYGVQPTPELHSGAFHGPTPNQIPGGQVITTKGLISLIQNPQLPKLIFDILGGPEHLPGAIPAAAASQPGTFQDQTQQGFGQYLNQATQGNKQVPLVFYCLSTECWMSYNAALRAIQLGYTNVLWYRGGIEAWKTAGLPTQR